MHEPSTHRIKIGYHSHYHRNKMTIHWNIKQTCPNSNAWVYCSFHSLQIESLLLNFVYALFLCFQRFQYRQNKLNNLKYNTMKWKYKNISTFWAITTSFADNVNIWMAKMWKMFNLHVDNFSFATVSDWNIHNSWIIDCLVLRSRRVWMKSRCDIPLRNLK